jgi:hypothetical protein
MTLCIFLDTLHQPAKLTLQALTNSSNGFGDDLPGGSLEIWEKLHFSGAGPRSGSGHAALGGMATDPPQRDGAGDLAQGRTVVVRSIKETIILVLVSDCRHRIADSCSRLRHRSSKDGCPCPIQRHVVALFKQIESNFAPFRFKEYSNDCSCLC